MPSLFGMEKIRLAWKILKTATLKYFSDNGLFLASGLAFDLLLYCIPLSLLIVSGLGFTLERSDQAMAQVEATIERLLPRSEQAFTQNISAIVGSRGLLGIAGFVLFFILSSAVFGSVRLVLNIVFQVKQPRSYLRGKGTDFLVMFGASVLFLLVMGFAWLLALVEPFGKDMPILGRMLQEGWNLASILLGFLFTMALFYVLYRFSPAQTLGRPALLVGSATGTLLFEFSKWAFTLYVQFAQANVTLYGALGGLIFFFLWLYYACTVFILGAESAWAYEHAEVESIPHESVNPV